MEVDVGSLDDELAGGHAAQLRRDRGRVLVPLARVADQGEIALHFLAMLREKAGERGRSAFLLAFEQHGHRDR